MFQLEVKILVLTCIYFAGWFLFEKVLSVLWAKVEDKVSDTRKPSKQRIPTLGVVTPLDQTTRYIKGLKHPDWRVRRISCIQLGEKRGSMVVQALIEALKDPKEEVSMAAGEALAKIGDPVAIATLAEHVQNLDHAMEDTYERLRVA
jgi:hypothetical protein